MATIYGRNSLNSAKTALLPVTTTGGCSDRLHKGLVFLQKHWHKPINVNDLVKASAMSRRGFLKAFKQRVGHGPGRMLRQQRIELGKHLLAMPELCLDAIPTMCGYRSVNSFWVAFRQVTGMSPGEYRSWIGQKMADMALDSSVVYSLKTSSQPARNSYHFAKTR